DIDGSPAGVQVISDDAAHIDAAIVDGRTYVQRAQVLSLEREAPARTVARNFGRLFQSDEVALIWPFVVRCGTGRVHGDIGAGQQRSEARDAAQRQARAHHPEAGAFAGQVFRIARDVG